MLKSFVANDRDIFFSFYFKLLNDLIQHLNKKPTPRQTSSNDINKIEQESSETDTKEDTIEQFKVLSEYKIDAGFGNKLVVHASSADYLAILLNMLQIFPKLENFDNFKIHTYKKIAVHVEQYICQLGSKSKQGVIAIQGDTFFSRNQFKMTDLLFLAQEPTRLFMYKAEYKFSYLSLLALMTISAADGDSYYKHLSIIINSIL